MDYQETPGDVLVTRNLLTRLLMKPPEGSGACKDEHCHG